MCVCVRVHVHGSWPLLIGKPLQHLPLGGGEEEEEEEEEEERRHGELANGDSFSFLSVRGERTWRQKPRPRGRGLLQEAELTVFLRDPSRHRCDLPYWSEYKTMFFALK